MKLCYMKKHMFRSRERLASAYYAEAKDKHFEKLPQTRYLGEKGIDNGFGWTINGFIENEQGELRAQHDQELAFCNGCHKTVGSTFDQTFSFARKVPGQAGWGYINLKEIEDVPNINEEKGEFLFGRGERRHGGDLASKNSFHNRHDGARVGCRSALGPSLEFLWDKPHCRS